MEIDLAPQTDLEGSAAASSYRRIHGRDLMALKNLRGAVAATDELCRIVSVETLAPNLWVTARFLDGSRKSFRPEKIRRATKDEEQGAGEEETAGECL